MRCIRLTFLTLFFFAASACTIRSLHAQADATYLRISQMPDDAKQIFAWINAANQISETTPKQSLVYIEKALKLSLSLKNERGEAYCYNSLGALNFTLEKYAQSISYFEKSLTLFKTTPEEKGYYAAKKYIGAAYEKKKDYENALNYYNQFLLLAKTKANPDDVIFASNGLARCNEAMNNIKNSEVYYQQVLDIETRRNNPSGQINASDNLGNLYEAANDSAKAFSYFESSQNIASQNGLVKQSNNYYNNANNYYAKRGNVKEQIKVNQQALEYNNEQNNSSGLNVANLQLGKLNLQNKNSSAAITYLKNSINLSEELGEVTAKEAALEAITEAYKEAGDYEQALLSFQELMTLQDSIKKAKNQEMMMSQNLSIELEQKEAQIGLLLENEKLREDKFSLEISKKNSDNRRNLYIIYGLCCITLVLLGAAYWIYRINRGRQKANMLLELKSLRTQMNPHFIFNSLNSINGFISMNDDRSANKYLSRFSQLMRAVLENSKHDLVTLESELTILKLYLELEHLRFNDKFDYQINISEHIDIETIMVPPMLIQPYIENAIWHGLRYLDDRGLLLLTLEKSNQQLIWSIQDNGIGRKASEEIKTKNQKTGTSTGMKNIEQRIEILNKMSNLRMTTQVTDLEKGTFVKVTMPII